MSRSSHWVSHSKSDYFVKMKSVLSLALLVAAASAATIDLRNKGDIEIRDCGE